MRDALSLLDQVLAFGGGRAVESEVRALLGTLDRRHVEAILNALAANDGAALMACVAQLDERAPDYDQALGELAASIQRMALLQALPDLRGEDEEQDALLAKLSAQFTPEDLQLLYQIAIMARRDLDFAPDARGGFEMALLRMLAFRPESAESAPAATPASGARRAAAGGAASAAPARGAAAVPAPAAANVRSGAGAETSASGGDWPAIVAQLGLVGSAAQLAAHCTLVARKGELVRLKLDRAGEDFRRPQVEQRLAQALEKYYGEPVRLDIAVSDAVEVTPARLQAQAADERQKAAEQSIEADVNVRAMREIFGATVQPGSVKPLN
jgi:DNA polymerase-3 subunit gamma/tau